MELSSTEFRLLACLMRHQGSVRRLDPFDDRGVGLPNAVVSKRVR
jgi:hypothetical protein